MAIGITLWVECDGVSQKDFLGKSSRVNPGKRVEALKMKGNNWKLTLLETKQNKIIGALN